MTETINKTKQQEEAVPVDNSNKMLVTMVSIGIACALLIVLTFEGTAPRIAKLKAEALQGAIFKVIPNISQVQLFEVLADGGFRAATEQEKGKDYIFAGYNADNELKGVAIMAHGQGYADLIHILYGYDLDKQQIVGLYVLESKETPGLGDKIEKDPAFVANFEALDAQLNEAKTALQHPITTVKHGEKQNPYEIDGITGATISSRTIGEILQKSSSHYLPMIQQHREQLSKMLNQNP
ncbi:FMN-binding protein [Persicobacter psychrovividus]|uniref:Ion-translocating oxidoreductase complex subunit G n=1 Tax=Persicobacter psychrovividus TaxID=387638 RepID=A0ABM7VI16_9BACT|nr:Na+-transporting NADH:ubiquinone oxidoreductase subunit 3 [Persicobacter psychrovividus]